MSDKIEQKNSFNLENLRKLIDTKTREEIATALKCDTSLITKHYNDQRIITVDYLIKYAEYFNVSVDYLLNKTDKKIALDTDEGKLIRSICDYTGLCEETIEKLHKVYDVVSEDFDNSDSFTMDFINKKRLHISKKFSFINSFLCSDKFAEVIEDVLCYIESMSFRRTEIKSAIDIAQDDSEPLIDSLQPLLELAIGDTSRLYYFEALEALESIINSYCRDEYCKYIESEKLYKYLSAQLPIKISKNEDTFKVVFLEPDNFTLETTDFEAEKLDFIRDKIAKYYLNIRKGVEMNNADNNQTE